MRVLLVFALLFLSSLPSVAQVITETSPTQHTQRQREAARQSLRDQIAKHEAVLNSPPPPGEAKPAGADAAEADKKIAEGRLEKLQSGADPEGGHADFLTQAGFTTGTTAPEIGVQVADLFFSRDFRLFIRATLPTKPDETPDESGKSLEEGQEAATPASLLNDRIRSALFDPYGGLLYLSGGYLRRVIPATLEDDGLFVDARLGAKFIQLEDTEDEKTFSATPFVVGSFGIRLQRRLFFDSGLDAEAGTFVLGVTGVVNRVIDASKSTLFTENADGVSELQRSVGSLNVSLGIRLPKLVAITVSATPWSSADTEKQFVIGFNVFSKD